MEWKRSGEEGGGKNSHKKSTRNRNDMTFIWPCFEHVRCSGTHTHTHGEERKYWYWIYEFHSFCMPIDNMKYHKFHTRLTLHKLSSESLTRSADAFATQRSEWGENGKTKNRQKRESKRKKKRNGTRKKKSLVESNARWRSLNYQLFWHIFCSPSIRILISSFERRILLMAVTVALAMAMWLGGWNVWELVTILFIACSFRRFFFTFLRFVHFSFWLFRLPVVVAVTAAS